MPVSPEEVVSPPATVPIDVGLLGSANIVEMPASSRWESGFVFQPANCIMSEVWTPCGPFGTLIVELTIDATGGSFVLQGTAGQAVLPYDATASELAFQIVEQSGWTLTPDAVTVRGGPGGPAPFFVVIQPINGVDWTTMLDLFTNPGDPLTGGVGIISEVVQLPPQGPEDVPRTKKPYDGQQNSVRYWPYVVEVPFTCSSWAFEVNDYAGKALRQLDAGLGKAIETEFWTGANNPANPNLKYWTPWDDEHIVNPGGAAAPVAVNAAQGVALLEAALAGCATGSLGMIHANPYIVERLAQWYLIDDDHVGEHNRLVTRGRRDIVVSGSGYPLTGPAGSPSLNSGEGWMFATGMVDVRLGEPYRGEQVAAATHDGCCTFAVLVDLEAPLA